MTAPACQLPLGLVVARPPVDAAALLDAQKALCALTCGDCLAADGYRVERFLSADGYDMLALVKGGAVNAGIWRGGEIVVAERLGSRRTFTIRKFAQALAWRDALDCCIWKDAAGLAFEPLGTHDSAPTVAGVQLALWVA